MSSKRTEIKRMMRANERPRLELTFLLADVEDPVNVGSAFRVADACKAKELLLTGITARPPHKLISKVGRSKDKRVPWRGFDDVTEAIADVRAAGAKVFAVEITPEARPYDEVEYPEQTCLLVGHEDHGVTKRALAACDGTIYIPMYGKGASLNVHVALAVTAFHVLSARRR